VDLNGERRRESMLHHVEKETLVVAVPQKVNVGSTVIRNMKLNCHNPLDEASHVKGEFKYF
jgi:hypothetical protein